MVYKILLIDDEPMMRRLMTILLKRHNHEVVEVESGDQAVPMAMEHQPDIILLDVIMPGIDGFEVLRHLRTEPETEDIPVIFLSAKGQVENRVEGLRLGADDYVTKPAEPEELMARIDSVILRSRREVRRRKGRVFGFTGVKGGVGTTTVIANLAGHFQQSGRLPLLIDMHLAFGNLAAHFGLDASKASIANLTSIPTADINPSSMQSVILEHSSKLRVIASPPNVPSWATFSAENLRTVVEQSAYTSRYVFLDLPRDPDIISSVSDQLSGLILVLGSEPSSLRSAQELTLYLGNIGLHDRLSAILIHRSMNEHQYVDAGMVAKQLGCLLLGTVPYKPDLYLRAEYEQTPMLISMQSSSDSVIFDKISSRLLNYVDTLEQFQKKSLFQSRHLA